MSEQINLLTRDYDVSIWTLQDSYITTLKQSGHHHYNQIQEPKLSIADDAMETFHFSIPMYIQTNNNGVLVKQENPIWYNVTNGNLIKNMRKIKVIFNKDNSLKQKTPRNKMSELKHYIPEGYEGNAELDNRKIISSATMRAAGYSTFPADDYATLYSSHSTYGSGDNQYIVIYTPIQNDGVVLTESQVISYFYSFGAISKESWMTYDALHKGIILFMIGPLSAAEVAEYQTYVNTWTDNLHNLQAAWDQIRYANDWFGDTTIDPIGYFNEHFTKQEDLNFASPAPIGPKVFEFIITKITESHTGGILTCEVDCEGLAFHELGKQGYKLSLSGDVFYDRTYKFYEGKTWHDNMHIGHNELPVGNIDYWMNELGIQSYYEKNKIVAGNYVGKRIRKTEDINPFTWYYKVDMDYSQHSLLPNGTKRSARVLYEDSYISSWDSDLNPKTVEEVKEKERLVDANESNIFNLTQTIAETFEVFCRYEYTYDDNFCITGRYVVFYNNFIKDTTGAFELTYPSSSQSISREYDATDITTKMFVRPEVDDSLYTGQISIIDTPANPTKEDYIMNFDYLLNIGTITQEQYDEIENYNKAMYQINCGTNQTIVNNEDDADDETTIIYDGLISLQEQLIAKQQRLTDVTAKVSVLEKEQEQASERIRDAEEHIGGNAQEFTVTDSNPRVCVLSALNEPIKTTKKSKQYKSYELTLGTKHKGIVFDSIRMFREYDYTRHGFNSMIDTKIPQKSVYVISNWELGKPAKAVKAYMTLYKEVNDTEISKADTIAKFQGWLENLNNSKKAVFIPAVRTAAMANSDGYTAEVQSDILKDEIGWIFYALGSANFKIIDNKNFKHKLFSSFTVNNQTYSLEISKKNAKDWKITKKSWNTLIAARAALRMGAVVDGITPANVTMNTTTGTATATPSWVTLQSNPLQVVLIANNKVRWTYNSQNASTTLKTLWKNHYKASYDTYEEFIGYLTTICLENEIKGFQPVYDSSDGMLIGLTGISAPIDQEQVYLTYKFIPTTQYTLIVEEWTKKLAQITTNLTNTNAEKTALETEVEELEEQIRLLLNKKFNTGRVFDEMMGPALRESYWQPENYHDYGDIYTKEFKKLKTDENCMVKAEWPADNSIDARMIWSKQLFTEEQKPYYEIGINLDKQFYPTINLTAFFESYPAAKAAFFNNLDTSCFSYYNDSFDRQYKTSNGDWTYLYNLYTEGKTVNNQLTQNWYYNVDVTSIVTYDINEDGSAIGTDTSHYTDRVYVERKDSSREYYMTGASSSLGFLYDSTANAIIPVLLMTGLDELSENAWHFIRQAVNYPTAVSGSTQQIHPGAQPMLGYKSVVNNSQFTSLGQVLPSHWIDYSDENRYKMVYPRIQVNSLQLRTGRSILKLNDEILKTPDDYYILTRDNKYVFTIKPEKLFESWGPDGNKLNFVRDYANISEDQNLFNLTYTISNGGTYIYIDAINVLKENAVPKVAYTVTPSVNQSEFITTLYNDLGAIVHINDADLKLDNVFGYISSIELDLDRPWQDSISVKNYKNKFEDLFSQITIQTEAMKKSTGLLSALESGALTQSIEETINAVTETVIEENVHEYGIIDAYLDSHFDGREVVIEELNKMWASMDPVLNDAGEAVAELFDLNNTNANILASLVQDIAAMVKPNVYYNNPDNVTAQVKPGDICIDADGNRYVATQYSGSSSQIFAPVYDGTVSKITGANVTWDAKTGIVDITGQQEINIKSGNDIHIAANAAVDIIGNETVNIGGTTINIGSTMINDYTATGDVESVETPAYGSINIVSSLINGSEAAASYVSIDPFQINMLSSNIIMKGSEKILMVTSQGTAATTSGIQISQDDGIWIGSGKGISLYAGNAFQYDDDTQELAVINGSRTSVDIRPEHIIMGTGANSSSVVKIVPNQVLIASEATIAAIEENGIADMQHYLIGSSFSNTQIMFALEYTSDNKTWRNMISLNQEGIGFAHAHKSAAELYYLSSGQTTADMFDDDIEGSFVKINSEGIRLGSTAELYVNMTNFKLQTDDTYGTRFAIGQGLHNIDTAQSLSDLGTQQDAFVGLVYNQHGFYLDAGTNGEIRIQGANLHIMSSGGTESDYNTLDGQMISEQIRVYTVSTEDGTQTGPTPGPTWTTSIPAVDGTNKYLWSATRTTLRNGNINYSQKTFEGSLSNLKAMTYTMYMRTNSETAPTVTVSDLSGWTLAVPSITETTEAQTETLTLPSVDAQGNSQTATVSGITKYKIAASETYIWSIDVVENVNGTKTIVKGPTRNTDLEKLNEAEIRAKNIASGSIAVPRVESTGIKIAGNYLLVGATGVVEINGNNGVNIYNDSGQNAIELNKNGISIASGANIALAAGCDLTLSAANLKFTTTGNTTISYEANEGNKIVRTTRVYSLQSTNSGTMAAPSPNISAQGVYTENSNWTATIPSFNISDDALESTSPATYLWSCDLLVKANGEMSYTVPVYESAITNTTQITKTYYTRNNVQANLTAPTRVDLFGDQTHTPTWSSSLPNVDNDSTTQSTLDDANVPHNTTIINPSKQYVWQVEVSLKQNGEVSIGTPIRNQYLEGLSAAQIRSHNIATGAVAVGRVSSTGIEINGNNLTVGSTGDLKVIGNGTVEIENSDGNNALYMNQYGLTITSAGAINIESGGDLNLQSGADLNIQSGGDLIINSGGHLNISGVNDCFYIDVPASITGSQILLRAGAEDDGDTDAAKRNALSIRLQYDSTNASYHPQLRIRSDSANIPAMIIRTSKSVADNTENNNSPIKIPAIKFQSHGTTGNGLGGIYLFYNPSTSANYKGIGIYGYGSNPDDSACILLRNNDLTLQGPDRDKSDETDLHFTDIIMKRNNISLEASGTIQLKSKITYYDNDVWMVKSGGYTTNSNSKVSSMTFIKPDGTEQTINFTDANALSHFMITKNKSNELNVGVYDYNGVTTSNTTGRLAKISITGTRTDMSTSSPYVRIAVAIENCQTGVSDTLTYWNNTTYVTADQAYVDVDVSSAYTAGSNYRWTNTTVTNTGSPSVNTSQKKVTGTITATVSSPDKTDKTATYNVNVNLADFYTAAYNAGWNECLDACKKTKTTKYDTSTGTYGGSGTTHYAYGTNSNGVTTYFSIGANWYQRSAVEVYTLTDVDEKS